MKLRKLNQEEHGSTRQLWEEIFTEDTSEFLDYYYSVKTKNNEIYVIEDQGEIVSMLHLNPYQMRIENVLYRTHYIVAVATKESYRKQGLMRQLLNHALHVMKERSEPFTFLMPASEAIYKPFGFRYVYEQKRCHKEGKNHPEMNLELVDAKAEDCLEIANFANDILRKYEVVAWRDEAYYQTMLSELSSESGGILIAKTAGEIQGVFCYAKEGTYIFHEPLFYEERVLEQAIIHLTNEKVLCKGLGEEATPIIMAKILDEQNKDMLSGKKIFLNEVV